MKELLSETVGTATQQCECTECHPITHLNMIKIVKFYVVIYHDFFKDKTLAHLFASIPGREQAYHGVLKPLG